MDLPKRSFGTIRGRFPEILAKSGLPIVHDHLTSFPQRDVPGADLFVQTVLEAVLVVRVPIPAIRLGPEVVDVVSASELAADEVVDFAELAVVVSRAALRVVASA